MKINWFLLLCFGLGGCNLSETGVRNEAALSNSHAAVTAVPKPQDFLNPVVFSENGDVAAYYDRLTRCRSVTHKDEISAQSQEFMLLRQAVAASPNTGTISVALSTGDDRRHANLSLQRCLEKFGYVIK